MSRTNIELDDQLVKEGMARFKCRTKKDLVHLALREALRREYQKDLLRFEGKIRWEGDLRSWRKDKA